MAMFRVFEVVFSPPADHEFDQKNKILWLAHAHGRLSYLSKHYFKKEGGAYLISDRDEYDIWTSMERCIGEQGHFYIESLDILRLSEVIEKTNPRFAEEARKCFEDRVQVVMEDTESELDG